MTERDIIDRWAIEDAASIVDRAVDDKRWDIVAGHFAESVVFDAGAPSDAPPAALPRSRVVQAIVAVNPPDKRTYHARTNVVTRIDGDRATLSSHSYGWNACQRFDPPVYEVWGTMDYEFARREGRWLITSIRLRKWREAGNVAVNAYQG